MDVTPGGDAQVAVAEEALTSTTIVAEADTTLRRALRFGNDGKGVRLGVSSASVADLERSLVRFSKSEMQLAVGPDALHKAEIELTVETFSAGWAGGRIEILPMVHGWPEGTGFTFGGRGPTWVCADDTNTANFVDNCLPGNPWGMLATEGRPLAYKPEATDSVALFTGGPRKIRFDVTADVQQILNGAANHGWMLKGQSTTWSGQLVNFRSRETSDPPRLIIEAGADQCPGNPDKGARGVCGCDVPDRDTNNDGVVDCFEAVVTATHDTTVRQTVPFGNDGKGQLLGVTKASIVALERGLVRVDTANIQAASGGRAVEQAYLELSIAGMSLDWLGGQIELREMTKDWVEGTGTVAGGSGPTWVCRHDTDTSIFGNLFNNCTGANAWGMQLWEPNRPFSPVVSARLPVQVFGRGTLRFDVTADVQRYLAGTTNRGWMVMGTEDLLSGAYVNFGSRQSGAPPRLLLKLQSNCPDDPHKSEPGECGCGVPDTNTDHDTMPDCLDACPLDNPKVSAGVCGCSVSDIDGDSDGVPDCEDECPGDPTKSRMGDCGCGDDPEPINTPCNDGICPGCFACDGAGQCGDPQACNPDPGSCTFTEFRGRTYWACGAATWSLASETCRDGGGHLADVDDVAEDAFLAGLVSARSWVGGNDDQGLWFWTTATGPDTEPFWDGGPDGVRLSSKYVHWAAGEPSAMDRCGAIDPSGGWYALACSDTRPFVCEMPGAESGVAECKDPVKYCDFRGGTCPATVADPNEPCLPVDQVDDIHADLLECKNANCAQSDAACLAAHCTGAATPPTGNSCAPVSDTEAHSCALEALPATCTLDNLDNCCLDDSQCGYCDGDLECDTAHGYLCGVDYQCARQDCSSGTCVLVGSGSDCRGVKRCGKPVATCITADDTGLCGDIVTCPVYTATEDDADPTLDPDTTFGRPDQPPEFQPGFPATPGAPSAPTYDDSCEQSGSCPVPAGRHHDWCHYDVEDTLGQHSEPESDHGESGNGAVVSFSFDPSLWMDYDATPGPLGLPDFTLDAGARFAADVHFDIGIFADSFNVLNLLFKAHADPCEFTTRGSELKVMGDDLLPELLDFLHAKGYSPIEGDDLPLEYPADPDTSTPSVNERVESCKDAYADFKESVERAKKAFKDAQWLMRKYDEARTLTPPRYFPAKDLCEQAKANIGPRGFAALDCDATTVEDVINAFVDYYRDVALADVRTKALQLAGESQLVFQQDFGQHYPQGEAQESEVIATVPFAIGPIPMVLEVEAFLGYGVEGTVDIQADMAPIANTVISVGDVQPEQIARAGVSVTPFAGAGIGLFVGVGFSFGIGGASAGVEGQLTLADLSLPVFASAGIELGSQDSPRTTPADILAVQAEGPDPIRSRTYQYGFTYAIGAKIRTENILRGVINARARIKFLFFSKTWRVKILEFPGFCRYDDGDTHKPECEFELITEGGSFEGHLPSVPWGDVEMPMPFVAMRRLPAFSVPVGAAVAPASGVAVPSGEFFYDRDCQCIDTALPPETEVEDRCYRDADCCPGDYDRCFLTPETGKNDCIECRNVTETCYEDSDCCPGFQCFKAPDDLTSNPAVCIVARTVGQTCNEDDDCEAAATLRCWTGPGEAAICSDHRGCDESCNTNTDCAGHDPSNPATSHCLNNSCFPSCPPR